MKMKNKKLRGLLTFLSVLLVMALVCQIYYVYQINWIMGKTSEEVRERYGQFVSYSKPPDEDGIVRNGVGYYCIIPARGGFLGTYPAYMFGIGFDQDGYADKCYFRWGLEGN